MLSGAGMLDFLACMSAEKLVLDAEAISMAQRLLGGINTPTPSLATGTFSQSGLAGEFLKLKETRALFKEEQYLPSGVIDRGSIRTWEQNGKKDAFTRAHERVEELLLGYRQPTIPKDKLQKLKDVLERHKTK